MASRAALRNADVDFFANLLDSTDYFRIALTFPAVTLFLDIETTGLSRYYDDITLIGWSLNGSYNYWIRGEDITGFEEALATAKAVVTFNGALFDLPFLRSEFPALRFPTAHIDLRFLLKRLGVAGPQKAVEKRLRIARPTSIADFTSSVAPLLWYRFIRGDLSAGRQLVEYNRADVLGMRRLLDIAISRLTRHEKFPHQVVPSTRFTLLTIPSPTVPSQSMVSKARSSVRSGGITVRDLLASAAGSTPRIVGIDLTGSETRPSGWSSLIGDFVCTRRIGTDDDLLSATREISPHLVSIDSPLSLPEGRVLATDDDPGRAVYGITRLCERTLRKRGINVYPSLIRSMQSLTSRGIQLAKRLREFGIPVIESFPGAAQDILAIPRKRASLELLKAGLVEFGLHGRYLGTTVSHDELDAITSAVVGLFFWAGRCELLGNEIEDFLVVPSRESGSMWAQKLAIGVSGEIYAGKTTAAQWLTEQGFAYSRPSIILAEILTKAAHDINRVALQELGKRLHEAPGQRWLIQQTLARCKGADRVVIDGIRFPEDRAFMIERFGPSFHQVYIDAPLEDRTARHVNLGGLAYDYDLLASHDVERQAHVLQSLSEVTISNSRELADFRSKVDALVSSLRRPLQ